MIPPYSRYPTAYSFINVMLPVATATATAAAAVTAVGTATPSKSGTNADSSVTLGRTGVFVNLRTVATKPSSSNNDINNSNDDNSSTTKNATNGKFRLLFPEYK